MNKILTAMTTLALALALSACEVPEDTTSSGASGSSSTKEKKEASFTPAQEQAISAAENYLDSGMGFSRRAD